MNKTATIVTIALIIVSAAMLSGCLTDTDQNSHDETIDRMAKLEAILTDPNYVEDEETLTAVAAEADEIPTPEPKNYQVGISVMQGLVDPTAGTGELLVTINGGKDFYALDELRVLVNNETIDVYPAECQVPRTIGCNIIGDWKVTVEGTFEDGTVQTLMNTRFNGLPNPRRGTTIAPGVTPTFPKSAPTPEPKSVIKSPAGYISISEAALYDGDRTGLKMLNVRIIAHAPTYDASVIYICVVEGHTTYWLENIRVEVDGKTVVSFIPEMEKCGHELRNAGVTPIYLGDGIENTGSIVAIGTFGEKDGVYVGDYEIPCQVLTPHEKFDYE